MNTSTQRGYMAQGVVTVLSPAIGVASLVLGMVNMTGEPYAHHGTLRHFMPVYFNAGIMSSILWKPGCSTINDHGCAVALKATDGLPSRGPLLRQVIDNAHHKMVISYIPNCWASLRRWQDAQESNRSLVTIDEFQQVDEALTNAKRQILTLESRLAASSDRYVSTQAAAMAALQQEFANIEITRTRLSELRVNRISEADVYGLFAGLPELTDDHLPRWKAHAENRKEEQLAMAPPAADEDERAIAAITGARVAGTPFNFDIDSFS